MTSFWFKSACLFFLMVGLANAAPEEEAVSTFDWSAPQEVRIALWRYTVGSQAPGDPTPPTDWVVLDSLLNYPENGKTNYWLRHRLLITGQPDSLTFLALALANVPTAYQVYWDGTLVFTNGEVAEGETPESPGKYKTRVILSQQRTTPGQHILELRVSDLGAAGERFVGRVRFGRADQLWTRADALREQQIFHVGAFGLAAIFAFALFLGGGRNSAYLYFAIYSLAVVVNGLVNILTLFGDFPVNRFEYIRWFFHFIAPCAMFLLGVFIIKNFRIPHQRFHAVVLAVALIILEGLGGEEKLLWVVVYFALLLGYAIRKRRAGSILVSLGILVSSYLDLRFFLNEGTYGYSFGMMFMVFCVAMGISRQIRQQNRETERALLHSARLENELLKRNIQPHFLMNTLLSVVSWIRQDPDKAVALIQALAKEFRLINQISGEREIPLQREIELCRIHLDLMGYRHNASYTLELPQSPPEASIPPMVFHTLVENGLTHAYRSTEDGTFRLDWEISESEICYHLSNDGSRLKQLKVDSPETIEEGMGIRYVKARLEESYPGRWDLKYGMLGERWRVSIVLPKTTVLSENSFPQAG